MSNTSLSLVLRDISQHWYDFLQAKGFNSGSDGNQTAGFLRLCVLHAVTGYWILHKRDSFEATKEAETARKFFQREWVYSMVWEGEVEEIQYFQGRVEALENELERDIPGLMFLVRSARREICKDMLEMRPAKKQKQ